MNMIDETKRKLTCYSTKALNAHAGIGVQAYRLAVLETDPGRVVPRLYPTYKVASEQIERKLQRAKHRMEHFIRCRQTVLDQADKEEAERAKKATYWTAVKQQLIEYLPQDMLFINEAYHRIEIGHLMRDGKIDWQGRLFTVDIELGRYVSGTSRFSSSRWVDKPAVVVEERGGYPASNRPTRYFFKGREFNAKKILERVEARIKTDLAAKQRAKDELAARATFLERLQKIVGNRVALKEDTKYHTIAYPRPGTSRYSEYKEIEGQYQGKHGTVFLKANPLYKNEVTFRVTLTMDVTDEALRDVLQGLDKEVA